MFDFSSPFFITYFDGYFMMLIKLVVIKPFAGKTCFLVLFILNGLLFYKVVACLYSASCQFFRMLKRIPWFSKFSFLAALFKITI